MHSCPRCGGGTSAAGLCQLCAGLVVPSASNDAETMNWPEFQRELSALLNRYGLEKPSNTPDHVLAEYLVQCLVAYNIATEMRGYQPPASNVVSLK